VTHGLRCGLPINSLIGLSPRRLSFSPALPQRSTPKLGRRFRLQADLFANAGVINVDFSTEQIRKLVVATLPELGLPEPQPIGESMLMLAGYVVGREFRFAGVRVVWMVSQEQIKFHGDDDEVLRVVILDARERTNAA
jgi:hypothetical protein